MPIRRFALALVLTVLTVALSVLPAHATRFTSTRHQAGTDPMRQGVYVIGDSITHMMSTSALRPEGVEMEGFPGRRVTALAEPYIAPTRRYWPAVEHIFTPAPTRRVRTVVIELGTNGADATMTLADAVALYLAGIAQVRATDIWRAGPRRIVLITPYRIPSIEQGHLNPKTGQEWKPYQWASKMRLYAEAMHQVAVADDHVCVMPWRAAVSKRPGLLKDGIHPNTQGRILWRDLLTRTVRTCR